MKKRILSILLALTLIFSVGLITACNNNEPASTPSGTDSGTGGGGGGGDTATTTDDPADDSPYATHLTISMSVMDQHIVGRDWETGEIWSPLMQHIMSHYNVDFDFYALEWGDFLDVTRMWLASGIAPDILFQDIHPSRFGEFYINATQDGFFRPYNLDANPNLKEAFAAAPPAAQAFMIDGNLYAWPGVIDYNTYISPYQLQGFIYRWDWAQEAGVSNANNIYTYDEWINMIKTVQEVNPGNVPGGVAGIGSVNWSLPRDYPNAYDVPGIIEFTRDSSGYTWGPFIPETLDVIMQLNELYRDGVIWADQIMAQADEAQDLFHANGLFVYLQNNIIYNGMRERIRDYLENNGLDNNDEDLITHYAENVIRTGMVESPNGGILSRESGGIWSHTIMNSQISDEAAERWESILDWMVSEEGYFTRAFGTRGEDWDLDGSGNFSLMWKQDADGNYIDPTEMYANWPITRTASNLDAKMEAWAPDLANQTILNQFNALRDTAMGPRGNRFAFDVGLAYFTGEEFLNVVPGDIGAEMTALMTINPDGIESRWNTWLDGRRAIIQPVLDELNAALN